MAKITKAMIATVLSIAAAPNGVLMLTQAEGADVVGAGLATVDTANVEGDKAAVSLTEVGAKLAAENAPPAADAPAATGFAIDDAVAIPTSTTRRGRDSGYPFDKLEVGQSFHVAKTVENAEPVTRLQSSVSGARTKYSVETGETETVEVKEYQRNADGKGYAKGEDGKRIVTAVKSETRPVMKVTRDFTVKAVDASDPRGEGARVWRIA
jgi:hypothetical protein